MGFSETKVGSQIEGGCFYKLSVTAVSISIAMLSISMAIESISIPTESAVESLVFAGLLQAPRTAILKCKFNHCEIYNLPLLV